MPDIFLYQGETSPNDIKLRDPTIAAGVTQTLTPSLFVDSDTFYVPTITPGAVTLIPSLFVDGDTFYSPTVTLGATPQTTTGGGIHYVRRLGRKRDGEETEEERKARVYAEIDEEAGIQAPLVPEAPVVQPAPAAKAPRKPAFVKFDDAPWRELLAQIEQSAAQEFAVNVEDKLALAAGDLADGLRLQRIEEENAIAAILMAELA